MSGMSGSDRFAAPPPRAGGPGAYGFEDWVGRAVALRPRTHAVIDGQLVPAASGRTYADCTARDGSEIAQVAACDAVDADRAVAAARSAFDDGRWSDVAPAERKRVLLRFAEAIRADLEYLALVEALDCGKPIHDTLGVDAVKPAITIQWYAEAIDKLYGEVAPTGPGALALVTREPIGVCGLIVPWNYPLIITAWKIGAALAAGNTVVLKPATQSPLSAIRLGELALDAGLPAGVLNVVPGPGSVVGPALARHPAVDKISFTGSTEVGKSLLREIGASDVKAITLELGGKSPQVVLGDVRDLEAAASAIGWGIFYNGGQTCNAGSRLVVARGVRDELVGRIADLGRSLAPGDPLDPATRLGAMVDERQLQTVLGYVDLGQREGARVELGGGRVREETGGYLRPAHDPGRRRQPDAGRARGDLRACPDRDRGRRRRRSRPRRERLALRAGGRGLDPGRHEGAPDRPPPASRHGLGEHLRYGRPHGAVRRLPPVRLRARQVAARPRRLHPAQDNLARPLRLTGSLPAARGARRPDERGSRMRVGFIGLGRMGAPMAANLVRAGFAVTVNDLRREVAAPLEALGAAWAATPRELAATADILVTMLPGPPQVEAVLFGPDGAFDGLASGATWIDMSTTTPTVGRRAADLGAARGIRCLDAPVSGMTTGATAGTLQIFVGGDRETVERVLPVLRAMGDPERIFHVGAKGTGYAVKLCLNLLWFIHAAAAAEVLVLGVRAGVDLAILRRALVASPANSNFLEHDIDGLLAAGDYDEGFTLDLVTKDLGLAIDLGRETGTPLEVSALVEQIHRRARACYGDGAGEMTAVKLVEEATGTWLRLPAAPAEAGA